MHYIIFIQFIIDDSNSIHIIVIAVYCSIPFKNQSNFQFRWKNISSPILLDLKYQVNFLVLLLDIPS